MSLIDGSVKNDVIFENTNYFFKTMREFSWRLMPPADCEIFVPAAENQIIFYTEYKGQDKFVKLKFD